MYLYILDCRCSFNGPTGSISLNNTTNHERDLCRRCCSWQITVAETFTITLTFSILTIPQCKYSILTVYNGPNDTSPVLDCYCGENATTGVKIRSSSNHFFIMLKSGSYGSHPKSLFAFHANYYAEHAKGLIFS